MVYRMNMGKQGFRLGLFAPLALGQVAKYENLFKSYSIDVGPMLNSTVPSKSDKLYKGKYWDRTY